MSIQSNMQMMPQTAIIANPENSVAVIRNGSAIYVKNRESHDRCIAACNSLLDTIKKGGMTDELDLQAARLIDKSRKTVKKLNELRSPVTKIFDQIRSEFTAIENEIDPTKSNSLPWMLQQQRNAYAARKREEEQRRQQEEMARKAAEAARFSYREECREDYRRKFNDFLVANINWLTEINNKVTLETYSQAVELLSAAGNELPAGWNPQSGVRLNPALTPEESQQIRGELMKELMPQFEADYYSQYGLYRQDILDRLPSKKQELEVAARASAEEAQRIQAEIKARETAEVRRKEEERLKREEEEKRKKELAEAAKKSESLFDLAKAEAPAYQPKMKVAKKLSFKSPMGVMQAVMMWWGKEGEKLTVADMEKMFRKQISYCEKLANNKDAEMISHPDVVYVDDVKAQ